MKKKDNMPELVYFGLLGVNSRPLAYSFVFLCLLLSIGSLIYGLKDLRFMAFCPAMLAAAYWYYYCVKWVDKNSSWD